MRIGLYADVANEEQPRGVGNHIVNLVEQLGRLDRENEYFLYYHRDFLRGGPTFLARPDQWNFHLRAVRFPRRCVDRYPSLWWKRLLPALVRADRLDVFHGPSHLVPALGGGRAIVTIHDVAFFHQADLYAPAMTEALRVWVGNALKWAGRVIALSENTRRDLEQLGVDASRIRVIYGGGHVVPEGEIRYDRREELRRTLALPERYILFVGYLHPRKNVPFLLRAFARLKQAGLPHKLVLAGAQGPASEQIEALIAELGLAGDVTITGYVEDWHLPLLYKMADLFVLPTLYEGFTLVTLEAMAYGIPVVSTDTSSIREGVGDAALLVPLNDVEALAGAMRSALTDDELRQAMIERGLVQARRFTWEQCAQETLSLYHEVCEGRRRRNGACLSSGESRL